MSVSERQNVLYPKLPESDHTRSNWSRLYGSAKSLAIANMAMQTSKPVLVITADAISAVNLINELKIYITDLETTPVIAFPDWETLPYDPFSPYQDIISERLQTLFVLSKLEQGVLVVPITTVMHRLLPSDYLLTNSLVLNIGQTINIETFRKQLNQQGYSFVEQVTEHGEVSVRGSLLDVFPMGANDPFRIDLFDDEIDSIRLFDIETQRSSDKIDSIRVLPAREVALIDEGIARFRANWRARFEGNPGSCPVYRDVSQSLAPAGIEYYLPLFYEETSSLFDYMNENSILVLDDGIKAAAELFWEDIESRYEQGSYDVERPILPPRDVFLNTNDLYTELKQFPQIHITGLAEESDSAIVEYDTEMPTNLSIDARAKDPLTLVKNFIKEFDGRVLIAAETQGRRETIMDLFKQHDTPDKVENWQSFQQGNVEFGIAIMPIEHGLIIHQPNIAIITEAQLFGERVMQRRLRKRKQQDADAVVRNLTELRVGAPVVHEEHGVGRYLGLMTLDVGGFPAEFIHLEYVEGDKLYVPVAALDFISRYTGLDPDNAPLHKLGSGQWQKARRKAAEKIYDVAAELLELHARRAARRGMSYDLDQDAYYAFVQKFPFEETPGQQDAIDAVITDMRDDKPMDRLVCGDAGFGKTEVAMRAAFIAAQNNKQVAILVPTTLLAQQHYQNFIDRFADWPVRVELLSRFRTKKQSDIALAAMADGKADIVVGTHKLLQSDIDFKNLGLIIIDEEHRFGVRQKEKFKALRSEIDVLTLTATPIPRTLNMALSDLRELSIISTPPSRRLAVKTFVKERSDVLLKEAMLREIKRGGQIFYLHNEVKSIEKTALEIEKLLPEARVEFAHGQMPEKQLESIMLDFYHRRFNVLVCTTIIETGIDVPTANTIIIDRADKFGLAQLYQLRGRVGRSHHRAYAYLIVPPRKAMTADAIKRLEAIEALEELGIGFTLATHDLEIRGAGEFLGEGQSGHIQEIGFGLYMELLDRAVQAMKEGKQPELDRPLDHGAEIDLHVPALIPEDYLPDVHMRLIMYKRIASVKSKTELNDLKEEMIDRFGLLPDAVKNLFEISKLKQKARPLGIRKIDLGLNGGRIFFQEKASIDPMGIIQLIQSDPVSYRLDGQDKLRINMDLPDIESRLNVLKYLFNEITLKNAA
ncbi:MAG TPA: transcription-repair coupling factor [Thiotrichaceae bacterium]|jgi:transcription-repair coupling factor (superfamily II helicase)|nr:transcription-repair coupling factor [Thiotrichaceae bacterium]HIM09174.1 transcription-repair coupling factor [Gammaproteobacteria bacterium]